jgi:hypothetical protein
MKKKKNANVRERIVYNEVMGRGLKKIRRRKGKQKE